MNPSQPELSDLSWVLDEHLANLPGVLRVVLLSADGLAVATSKGVERDMAERMAAAASGIQSLSRAGAEFADCPDEPWELTLNQYGGGSLLLMAAGEGTYLAVASSREVDLEAMSFAAQKTVDRLGRELGVRARTAADSSS